MQEHDPISEQTSTRQASNEERLIRQANNKTYKSMMIVLIVFLALLIIYISIMGIEHVSNSAPGMFTVGLSMFIAILLWVRLRKKATRILKSRVGKNEEEPVQQ